ncbi:structural cement protein Gp24 [Bartonella sp. LJL80]
MPFQTNYKTTMDAGLVGRRVNMEEWNTVTCLAENTGTYPINYGQPVQRGTAGEQVRKLANGIFRGITELDQTTGDESYSEGYNVPVMESGVIWVAAGGVCTIGGEVKWNPATEQYSDAGTVTIPNAEFDSSATAAGDIVKVRLHRIPGASGSTSGGSGGSNP